LDLEKLNLKKPNFVEVKEQYQVRISNRFAALENLDEDDDDDVNISRAWEGIRMSKLQPHVVWVIIS
jgi:hypothetical protein